MYTQLSFRLSTAFNIEASTSTTIITSTPLQPANNISEVRRRKRRRDEWKSGRPPAVDSTLLRFIKQQKDSLIPPVVYDYTNDSTEEATTRETLPYEANLNGLELHNPPHQDASTIDTSNENGVEKSNAQSTVVATDDKQISGSWWGQYNSHRVELLLLSLDDSLDRTEVAKAGARVQAQVLARTIRRRIRNFLKERDQTWKSDLVSSLTIGSMGEMIGYSGGHSLEDSLDVMTSHGLTVKDITEILQHTPGIVLMRPRGSENGEALDDTLDRVFKLLCVTLKLRKYDARRIIRDSPGLLTMRGSKHAHDMVSLFHQMGVSYTALARDKAALTVFLSRSPSDVFRLVAFLASDAIRMPVDQIGPLLRRPISCDLLDNVAPLPHQATTNQSIAIQEEIESELDPWIASAIWGRQSQVRRERTNGMYKRMTETAWTLRNKIGTADLGKVVSAYPSVLMLDAEEQILPNAKFLMRNLGIEEDDLPRVLQLYPALLGLPTEKMEGVSRYLLSFGIQQDILSSMFRAFPATLALDVERDMKPVVEFLQGIGVMDVGRFVARVPAILGYSVENDLLPKWKHLRMVSSDARFEVTKFPAYFTYPFDRVIKARYEYIRDIKKFPAQLVSVDKVVSYGDTDFAVKVMRDEDGGMAYRDFVNKRSNHLRMKKSKRNRKKQGQLNRESHGEKLAKKA